MTETTPKLFNKSQEELKALRELASQWQKEFWEVDAIMESLAISGTQLYYLEDGDQGLWSGMLLSRSSFEEHELFYVYVRPEKRGQGLGKKLMKAWFKDLEATGETGRVFLEVRPSNEEAIALYQKFGFRAFQSRPAYYPDGEDALIFVLEFPAPV